MRVLIDSNVLFDVLQNREPYVEESTAVWDLCQSGAADGHISALTFANMVYVMRKELTPELIREVLATLTDVFRFEDLSLSDLKQASAMMWPDFEDALQTAAAVKIGAEYIVTRNLKDFKGGPVPCLSPSAFLDLFRQENNPPETDPD